MKIYNQENEHNKVVVKVLKYCRKTHEVLFRSLQPVQSREAVEKTQWSRELLCKRRYLENRYESPFLSCFSEILRHQENLDNNFSQANSALSLS